MRRCRWCGSKYEHDQDTCRYRYGFCIICEGQIDHATYDWFTAGRGGQNVGNSEVHMACYNSPAGTWVREKDEDR